MRFFCAMEQVLGQKNHDIIGYKEISPTEQGKNLFR